MEKGKKLKVSMLVGRVRLSYPVFYASVVDSALYQLLIAKLLYQVYNKQYDVWQSSIPTETGNYCLWFELYI